MRTDDRAISHNVVLYVGNAIKFIAVLILKFLIVRAGS